MSDFVAGQRWINTVEPQLGLGTVLSTEHRSVNIMFPASGESRTYSKQSAPLARIHYAPGDTIRDRNGDEWTVQSLVEQGGLITYSGTNCAGLSSQIHESDLNTEVRLDQPANRLFNKQIDSDQWLELRYRSMLYRNALHSSELRGLTGCRTNLIPHQLYIAHEVARRFAPRVLLADEVGLGKTIEAGLIVHQQLITERANRVLIVVPKSLVLQWFVELVRRFNLAFSVFDEKRCRAICASSAHENPFFGEQLVLCSLEFLTQSSQRADQAIHGEWDLVVVDEAHHLRWSDQRSSREYRIVERLSAQSKGLLLLTGTPEQLGKASHFATLRLLDPDRFHDLQSFFDEETNYHEVADAMHGLLNDDAVGTDELKHLRRVLSGDDDRRQMDLLQNINIAAIEEDQAKSEMIDHLLDRHGTGRVLFRNTRATVAGFPKRLVLAQPLSVPRDYRVLLESLQYDDLQSMLCPETLYRRRRADDAPNWTQIDPRANWLVELVQSKRPAKVLVITATNQSAVDLADYFRTQAGITAAVFHSEMTLIERDRAAAFFANPDAGCPLMIASEIGSEGRNFQFSQDLVLFDLPFNPDLLEQRIGRLDRIGQQSKIRIYVPHMENSPQETLYRWYQEALDAFRKPCPIGPSVFSKFRNQLLEALKNPSESVTQTILSARTYADAQRKKLERGRDRLLEYNSCRPETARRLVAQACFEEQGSTLPDYMDQIFDCFGVDSEIHGPHCLILKPGNKMAEAFPYLTDEGTTITYDRATALANEDIQYLTWDHPMVVRIMERILNGDLGKSAFTALEHPDLESGLLLLECLFVLQTGPSGQVIGSHYLPPTAIRVVVDENGNNRETNLSHEQIQRYQRAVPNESANQFIASARTQIGTLIRAGEEQADRQARQIREDANSTAMRKLTAEIDRLKALRRINPNIRIEEIRHFEKQRNSVQRVIDASILSLEALRVMVSI